jgi:hypothetical protein
VTLQTLQQLGTGAVSKSTFGLDHSWNSKTGSKTNVITTIRDSGCTTNQLTGPIGGKSPGLALQLKKAGLTWSIVPLPVGNDCSIVNLISGNGENKGKYMKVMPGCNAFSWGGSDQAGANRFKLTKLSELVG